MKRILTVIAVLAIGFLAVSCGGGGNVSRVKNGVFSGYDNSITVGKALENNRNLSGGKWESKEIGGRQYVAYTVTITGSRLRQMISAAIENGWGAAGTESAAHPAYRIGSYFTYKLSRWQELSPEKLAATTSMSADDVRQAYAIFEDKIRDQHNALPENIWATFDEDPFIRNSSGRCLKDKYYGQWFLDNRDAEVINSSWPYDRMLAYSFIVTSAVVSGEPENWVKDGMLAERSLDELRRLLAMFENPDAETLNREIAASILQYNADYQKAQERLQSLNDDYYIGLEENPMLTIDSFEAVISFLMNEDKTFTPNMVEVYTEVTLDCYNGLKVRFNPYNTSNKEYILDYIYKDEVFTPDLLFERIRW